MDWNITAPADRLSYDPAEVFSAGLIQHHLANTAYPIGHVTTMRPYRVTRRDAEIDRVAAQAWSGIDELCLYVHVPFCEKRCSFCEYTVVDPKDNQSAEDTYFDLLIREFELWGKALDSTRKTLIGFDIGGGTPALPKVSNTARVIDAAHRHFQFRSEMEISLETTPRIAAHDPQKMRDLRQLGIDRISMGVQTIQPSLLKALGRNASAADFSDAPASQVTVYPMPRASNARSTSSARASSKPARLWLIGNTHNGSRPARGWTRGRVFSRTARRLAGRGTEAAESEAAERKPTAVPATQTSRLPRSLRTGEVMRNRSQAEATAASGITTVRAAPMHPSVVGGGGCPVSPRRAWRRAAFGEGRPQATCGCTGPPEPYISSGPVIRSPSRA